jgi:hypothetical protein
MFVGEDFIAMKPTIRDACFAVDFDLLLGIRKAMLERTWLERVLRSQATKP